MHLGVKNKQSYTSVISRLLFETNVSEGDNMIEMLALQTSRDPGRWQTRANCLGVDPDLFFPERGASTREAKSVCSGCEVKDDCLEYALSNGEKFGIWGGLSERERRRLRRQRALVRKAMEQEKEEEAAKIVASQSA